MVKRGQKGFSLTEVLLAVGTLAVGMVFIAGVFPVAIYYATVSSERTIAAVVAEEAFAKIQQEIGNLDQIDSDNFFDDLEPNECINFIDTLPSDTEFGPREFQYPSTDEYSDKQYCWSAILRLVQEVDTTSNPRPLVQVTVFVSRKAGASLKFPDPNDTSGNSTIDWPAPYKIDAGSGTEDNELDLDLTPTIQINDGAAVVDDRTGRIYRVLERYRGNDDDTVQLDKDWIRRDWNEQVDYAGTNSPDNVWFIPPPSGGGRNPCVGVYQRLIRF
jgi:type II secretory pathway pseudopilin PulG